MKALNFVVMWFISADIHVTECAVKSIAQRISKCTFRVFRLQYGTRNSIFSSATQLLTRHIYVAKGNSWLLCSYRNDQRPTWNAQDTHCTAAMTEALISFSSLGC